MQDSLDSAPHSAQGYWLLGADDTFFDFFNSAFVRSSFGGLLWGPFIWPVEEEACEPPKALEVSTPGAPLTRLGGGLTTG